MDITNPYCHTCSCVVEVPAMAAWEYMSDGMKQAEWTFGSMDRRKVGDHLFVGTSMFDNSKIYIRIDADRERLMVYYYLGPDPENLQPRNVARIMPGNQLGSDAETCLITLMAWRSSFMSDDRWKQLCVSHETQMFIIKARLERR